MLVLWHRGYPAHPAEGAPSSAHSPSAPGGLGPISFCGGRGNREILTISCSLEESKLPSVHPLPLASARAGLDRDILADSTFRKVSCLVHTHTHTHLLALKGSSRSMVGKAWPCLLHMRTFRCNYKQATSPWHFWGTSCPRRPEPCRHIGSSASGWPGREVKKLRPRQREGLSHLPWAQPL